MPRKVLISCAAAVLVASAGASACSRPAPQPSAQSAVSSPSAAAAAQPAAAGGAAATHHSAGRAASLRELTEPQAGMGPVYRLIAGARSSIDLTMYELADHTAEADLAAAAARGADVRVILDRHLEHDHNTAAYEYLAARRVHVRWAPASTTYHQKTLTVDGATSVIMTFNLVARDYPSTRDFGVIDTNRADVAAIAATFNADFTGRGIRPPDGTDLVWSPTNAQTSVLSVIDAAAHTVAVEDEEMGDPAVTSALAGAARRGVRVTVIMTRNSEWDQAFATLARAGARIRLYADDSATRYIHAKAIVADAGRAGQRVLTGSQNFSAASLGHNRELGILTRDPAVVRPIAATLAADSAQGTPYSAAGGPAPSSAPSGGPAARGRCTATARVYDAGKHENDVYVHSNQPGQDATATADGYSHTRRTNGSGYAVIYLNGPAAGAKITVRVGGATCTTRD